MEFTKYGVGKNGVDKIKVDKIIVDKIKVNKLKVDKSRICKKNSNLHCCQKITVMWEFCHIIVVKCVYLTKY